MTDEQKQCKHCHCNYPLHDLTCPVAVEGLAAGASEGQAEPVAIYHGNGTIDCGDAGHHNLELLKLVAAGTKLYTRPSAEIAALRERIAGMEKDAEKRRDALIKALAAVAVEYVADRHLAHYSRQWEAVIAKEPK